MATSTLGSGTLVLAGTTSGTTTVTATAVAGTTTLTLPAATDTLVGKATTDTLTNKTLTGAAMNGTVGATTPAAGAFTTLSATGVTTVQAGTLALPAITTTGDTNTGIFFPAADTIAFSEGGAEVMRLDSSANLQFNSGYGSVATAYGCRAWVNFNGSANTNLSGTYTRTSPSTTLTVTATAHGLIVGSSVNLDFTTGTGLDGIYTVVTVADANTFTITTVASTTTSGNVTLLRNTIRVSGNVSSITDNGTGDYTVNFTTAMPDADYCAVFGGRADTSNADANVSVLSERRVARTANAVRLVTTFNTATTPLASDFDLVSVAIFR